MAISQICVAKLYASVIEDVIGGVREFFVDEGVDEQVLLELRHTWELKLKTTKAVEVNKPETEPQPPMLKTIQQQRQQQGNSLNGLQSIYTGPIMTAALALPPDLSSNVMQPHATAALQGHTSSMLSLQNPQVLQAAQSIQTALANGTSADGTQRQIYLHQGGVPQIDGVRDSTDEDDNDDDNDDDDDDNDDDEKDDDEDPDAAESPAIEEEPLNSGDDVSEDDPTEMFETDNVVVCQYDKITRSRNKWKFHLKDGIMNLQGKDFVFQKSNGDAEW